MIQDLFETKVNEITDSFQNVFNFPQTNNITFSPDTSCSRATQKHKMNRDMMKYVDEYVLKHKLCLFNALMTLRM